MNKFVWSGLGWDPEADVVELLRQYSRAFVGEEIADEFAQGLLALEGNWQGPLAANALGREDVSASFRTCGGRAEPQILVQLAVPAGALPGLLRQLRPEAADRRDRVEKEAYQALGKARQTGDRWRRSQAVELASSTASRLRLRLSRLERADPQPGRRPVREHPDATERSPLRRDRRGSGGEPGHAGRPAQRPALAPRPACEDADRSTTRPTACAESRPSSTAPIPARAGSTTIWATSRSSPTWCTIRSARPTPISATPRSSASARGRLAPGLVPERPDPARRPAPDAL